MFNQMLDITPDCNAGSYLGESIGFAIQKDNASILYMLNCEPDNIILYTFFLFASLK